MRYLIGEVARALGLTTAALHYYEHVGVSETRIGDKTRRQYSVQDVLRFASYRKYRSMEIPMKDIADQFADQGISFEEIGERLDQQAVLVEEMMERYRLMHEDILWFRRAIAQATDHMERVDIVNLPETYVLSCGQDGIISHDKAEQAHLAQWLEHMPATRISEVCDPSGSARFAYSVDAARGKQLGLDQSPGVLHITPGPALHTFVSRPRACGEQPEFTFALLRKYLAEHGFEQSGFGLSVDLCVAKAGSERNTLCEVWLPFR